MLTHWPSWDRHNTCEVNKSGEFRFVVSQHAEFRLISRTRALAHPGDLTAAIGAYHQALALPALNADPTTKYHLLESMGDAMHAQAVEAYSSRKVNFWNGKSLLPRTF